MRIIEKISDADLLLVEEKVKKDIKYGREALLIESALKQNPYNKDIAIVSMKICLIDLTNGTNLMRNLGKNGGLYDFADKITKIDFDRRISDGDISIVNELSKWTYKKFNKNLFSFISKYCLYHNVYCYDKDDFVIYDSVLVKNINKYISCEDFKKITGKKLYKNSLVKYKYNFEYENYKKILDFIIIKNNITIEKAHRKLDWFIWDKNRKHNSPK